MPTVTSKFTFRDTGWATVQSSVAAAGSLQLRVGIVGEKATFEHTDTGLSVVEIGLINEFGSAKADVPERSFLRSTFRKRSKMFANLLAIAIRRVVFSRTSAHEALDWVGDRAADEVRATINGYVPPPNAELTIANKGFDHPLIETGLLLDSIAHRIVRAAGAGTMSDGIPEVIE